MTRPEKKLRVLHTSDWHLGRTLHERIRDDEFDALLTWMLKTIEEQRIDVLLIAGDIFDTSNASYSAQQKYYNFCTKLNQTSCSHAVITSGNHDSTSFIDVPSSLLGRLGIHVIGQPRFVVGKTETAMDEIVVLRNDAGEEELIVCAVPFLNDADVRTTASGEETETKEQKVIAGIASHYDAVANAAEKVRNGRNIPVIAMGHLFVQGGKWVEDDGVRQTYVGSLGGVNASIFSTSFDYVALGHLHVPQIVGNCEHIRYSGSPMPMGFGEAGQQKSVCILEFDGKTPEITIFPVPEFHRMERIIGNRNEIETRLKALEKEKEEIYIAVIYTGEDAVNSVGEIVSATLHENSNVLCFYTQDKRKNNLSAETTTPLRGLSLSDITEKMIFEKLLESERPTITDDEKSDLLSTFNELLIAVTQQQ